MGRYAVPFLDKATRALARLARRQGWTIEIARGNHVVWTAPDGTRLVDGSSPSDYRGRKNHLAALRRAGLRVPRKGDPSS